MARREYRALRKHVGCLASRTRPRATAEPCRTVTMEWTENTWLAEKNRGGPNIGRARHDEEGSSYVEFRVMRVVAPRRQVGRWTAAARAEGILFRLVQPEQTKRSPLRDIDDPFDLNLFRSHTGHVRGAVDNAGAVRVPGRHQHVA